MDDEIKPLLLEVLKTVRDIKEEHGRRLDQVEGRLKAIEGEQRQIKSMMGSLVVKEVARLDGRIDQLAQDTALNRKAG